MYTRKTILFILISILFSFKSIETRTHSFIEKIYTQTDRSLYFPGDTIWFKSYITNVEGKISTISNIMNAELISPKGTVVKTINLSINQGYAYGDFKIENEWVGGLYKIRMYTNWMKNYGNASYFEKELIVQKVISPNLLMTLDFDKKAYGSHANVIAHFEVKDLNNNPLKNQKFQFNVKIKGKTTTTKNVVTDVNGKHKISFYLPDHLKTTDVLLNVLVPHKSSKESISRSVPVTLNAIDLQFFPESGSAMANINNTIAFKAVNEFGKPADISGDILDHKGQIITTFKSYHDGMGSFSFTPHLKQYYAKITAPYTSDSLIALPKIKAKGTIFNITKANDIYNLNIFSTENNPITLIVSNAYKTLLTKQLNITNNSLTQPLNTANFPAGIIRITLQDTYKNHVAERLLFINKSKQLNIVITLDKTDYDTREKVKVNIKTTDAANNPMPSNLSLSVTDNKLVTFADDKQDNICSYLLMSSELKGKIHKPSFYFNPNKAKADKALDYVMLTHGWRNYLKTYLTPTTAEFSPDLVAVQHGKVVDKNYKGVASNLLLFDKHSNKVIKFKTNAKGQFSFKIEKTKQLILLAYTNNGKTLNIIDEKLVKNTISKTKQEANTKTTTLEFNQTDFKVPLKKPIKETVKTTGSLAVSLDEDTSKLDEVVITCGYYNTTKRESTGSIVKISSHKIFKTNSDNILKTIQGSIAGVNITNNSGVPSGGHSIQIRGKNSTTGNSQPMVVVDGVPYTTNNDHANTFQNIEPSDIKSIEVIKNSDATAIYGSRGSNGVILVTTKSQNSLWFGNYKSLNNKKFNNYTTKTFYNYGRKNTYTSKQFYIPVYENTTSSNTREDFRQTIYWNPVIQTDENGEATFEYYNSDAITSFVMTAEGIAYNGLIGKKNIKYATKKTLNIDFKTPNYMALNDTISLPIIVSNTSNKTITANLKIKLPEALKTLEPLENFTMSIKPNAHNIKTIHVVPIKKVKKTVLNVSVTSGDYSDTIDKEITIISPYFPTQASISGYKNDNYQFNVNHVVNGSLKAEFSIYTDIVGNVMDGIASLIRQPYGCFEQVSSSTYPNILILKYLKETNKSNPEIEKKAMAFITEGYKKLAAYETSKNGFEWYGHAPPHEALSAYGLMEFTEMKAVYDKVSEPMIKRTVDYLISRKNGKGGFNQNRGKYGFSAAPEHVNNAYIIYALSESGIPVDIEKEYNFTFLEAINSNDTYRMALMACASFNLNKTENAKILMQKIKNSISVYDFDKLPSEHTITRSYGNSKTIETAAFTVLALLKQGDSEYLVNKGIEYLLSKRKYGRFGSTQATSMALKALITYTITQKQKIITHSIVEIQINGKRINQALTTNNEGKIVIEGLEKYIKRGSQNISINFTNPKETFPYQLHVTWDSTIPNTSSKCKLQLETVISNTTSKIGETIRMDINVTNKTNTPLPMATAIIGIPSGTSVQPWQLKEITEKHKADYFEIFDNYLVFYWKEFNSNESKSIQLDLKAEILGNYQAPASSVYLYYTDEHKHWIKGNDVTIETEDKKNN